MALGVWHSSSRSGNEQHLSPQCISHHSLGTSPHQLFGNHTQISKRILLL